MTVNKKVVETKNAPSAIGPYSQAIQTGNLVFVSGQIPLDPKTGDLIQGSIEKETHQVLTNLKAVVEASGSSMEQVVRTTIFLKDMNDFVQVNEVYGSFFPSPFPARACVEVSRLPKDVNVEIDAIANI